MIDIFGTKYKIKEKDSIIYEGIVADGLIDFRNHTIYLVKSLKKKDKLRVLYHEMGHGIIHETGLDQSISLEVEEILVQNFAKFFANYKGGK